MNTLLKCPICKTADKCQYVFVEHWDKDKINNTNPGDIHKLYVCPQLHIYAEDGELIKPRC